MALSLTKDSLNKLDSVEIAELCRKCAEVTGYFIHNTDHTIGSQIWDKDRWLAKILELEHNKKNRS